MREKAHAGSVQDDFLRQELIQICVLCRFLSPTFPKKGARADSFIETESRSH